MDFKGIICFSKKMITAFGSTYYILSTDIFAIDKFRKK